MNKNNKEDLALLKYSVIVPLVNGTFEAGKSKQDFFRLAAAHEYPMPDGSKRVFSIQIFHKILSTCLLKNFTLLLEISFFSRIE